MILMPTPVQPSFSLCKWARNFSYPSAQLQKFCACVQLKLLLPPCVQLYDHTVRMELTGEQLKIAETLLKSYLPRSRQVCPVKSAIICLLYDRSNYWLDYYHFFSKVYGYLVLRNRVNSDPVKVLVDRWPEFCVIVCKPQYEQVTISEICALSMISVFAFFPCLYRLISFFYQEGDLFKDTLVFAKDEGVLEEMIRKTSVFDWTQYLCVGNNEKHFCFSCTVLSLNGHIINWNAVTAHPSLNKNMIHSMLRHDNEEKAIKHTHTF